jgi:hypothetical protein
MLIINHPNHLVKWA